MFYASDLPKFSGGENYFKEHIPKCLADETTYWNWHIWKYGTTCEYHLNALLQSCKSPHRGK
jgi:hypothetical protein